MIDPLGDRMKAHETATRMVLPAKSYLVLRCDGRGFHRYTAGLERPFDARLAADMDAVCADLVGEVSGALLGYTQSDEISIVASDLGSPAAEHWFGGVVQKIASCAASFVTARFNARRADLAGPPATFDARVFSLPSAAEVVDYLAWRQADARRNAVNALCQQHLGRRAVHGVSTRDRIQLLAAAGVRLDDYDPGFVDGRAVTPAVEVGDVVYRHKRTGELVHVDGVRRRVWRTGPAPRFSDPAAAAHVIVSAGTTRAG